jgi:hypothetical protein
MKHLFTNVFISGSLLLISSYAQAQVTFGIGPRVGLNASTAPYEAQTRAYNTGYRAGLEAGLVGSLGAGHFAVQPAVLYSQKGFTIHDAFSGSLWTEKHDDTYRLHYLTIPVSFAFTQQVNGQGLQVALGGYLGFLLGGKFQGATTYIYDSYYNVGGTPLGGSQTINYAGDIATHSSVTTFYSRGTDAGLQGSIGYRYGGALLQVGYSLGLRDLGYKSTFGNTYYNRAFQVSLTYLFGPKS